MLGDKSWALPYFGGLKSPLASKSTLYNAWLARQPSTVAPVVPVVPGTASQKPIQTLPTLSEQIDILSKPRIVSAPEEFYAATPATGTGRVSGNSTGADDTGASPLSGMGLGKLGSTGVSLGSAVLMGMGGVPLAGPLSEIAGMIAGNGINTESLGNMAISSLMGAAGVPGLLLGALKLAGFNPMQGFTEATGNYSGTPGYQGGFFGNQGIGQGLDSTLANYGQLSNMSSLGNIGGTDPIGGDTGLGISAGGVSEGAPGMGDSLGGGLSLPGAGLSLGVGDTLSGYSAGGLGGGIDTSSNSGFNSGSWGMSSNSNYGMGGGSMDTSPGSGFNTGSWGMSSNTGDSSDSSDSGSR